MNDIELMCRSERRFGRLEAYEKILHYSSLLALWIGFFSSTWAWLTGLAVAALLRAGWAFVIAENTRQHDLVMADEWEKLDHLCRP